MASIVKRGKTYSVVYYEGDGKDRHQVWISGLNYTAAKARKAQLEVDQENNTHIDQNNITVGNFLREFLVKYGEKKWVASTYDGNVGLLENYVYPYLEEKKLRSIRTKTVDDYYHFLLTEAEPASNMGKPKRKNISPSTIHDIHKVLRCAFNLAVRWEYIAKNPFLNATLPEHHEKERKVLEPVQVLDIMNFTCRPEYYDLYALYCAIHLAISCTMRGGEICGLQWDRIDYEQGLVKVDRVIDRVDKKMMEKLSKMEILFKFPNLYPGTRTVIVLKQPKTEGSIRDIEIPNSTLHALTILKEMQEKLKVELGPEGYMDYGLVICQANGRPIMTEHLNKRFKDALVELNDGSYDANDIVFHSLRHASASIKLYLDGDLNSIKHAGGWANLEMLIRRYGNHSFAKNRKTASEKMDAFLTGKEEKKEPHEETSPDVKELMELARENPDLLTQFLQSIQRANK